MRKSSVTGTIIPDQTMLSKILRITGFVIIAAVIALMAVALVNMKDRNRGYDAGMRIVSKGDNE